MLASYAYLSFLSIINVSSASSIVELKEDCLSYSYLFFSAEPNLSNLYDSASDSELLLASKVLVEFLY
jgi:hypothetical protein